jgi:hypothetical protein
MDGNYIDVNTIAPQVEALRDPSKLLFTQQVDPYGLGQCSPIYSVDLPVPCGAVDGFKYRVTILGGAITKNDLSGGFFPGTITWNWTLSYQTVGNETSLANQPLYFTSAYQGDPVGACQDALTFYGELPVSPVDPELSDYLLAYPAFQGQLDGVPDTMGCYDRVYLQAIGDVPVPCSAQSSAGALFVAFDPGQCY